MPVYREDVGWDYQVFCLEMPTCGAETFSTEDKTSNSWAISEAVSSPGAKAMWN